jgi:hypothetical protein
MESIFDRSVFEHVLGRIKNLESSSAARWGKMNISQMLHHINLTIEAPLRKIPTRGKPVFFMKFFKSVLYNDKPFSKGSPTPREFKISGSFDFALEKQRCMSNLKDLYNRNMKGDYHPHAFFGKLTNEQWGKHFFKHLDHHLKQFGV